MAALRRRDESGRGGGRWRRRLLGSGRGRLHSRPERARPDGQGLLGLDGWRRRTRAPRGQGPARCVCDSTSVIDVERARAETPGCEQVAHLNNAGSALMPQLVLDAVVGHLELEARIGGYEAHDANAEAIDRFYSATAELIGARPREIAFCSSATRAWDMAFYSFRFERGDRILTSVADYISNYLAFLQTAERTGAEVVTVPNDEHGQVSVERLRELVDERVKLIAITHVPTNGGLVNPVAEAGAIAHEAGIPYLVDACQSVGQLPVDVDA